MWKCPYCETYSPEEAAFCVACGQPRTAPSIQTPQGQGGGRNQQGPVNAQAPAYAPAGAAPAPAPKKKGKTALLICGIVLGLALIALGLWFFVFRTPHFRLVSYTTPHFRLVSYTYTHSYTYSSSYGENQYDDDPVHYTYLYAADGQSGSVRNDDPDNTGTQSFTCDKNGALLSLVTRDEDGTIRSRVEYENDKWGNHVRIRQYNSENVLVYYREASYNRYKVAESIVATGYNDDGTLNYRTVTIFSAPELGTYTETNANGSTVSAVIRRVYNDRHQLVQESWEYDDGTKRTYSYVRDEYYNVLSETRIYEYKTLTSTSTYTYVYERVR